MELINALGLNWPTLISQLINFGILYFLLKKFALDSLMTSIESRQREIASGLKNAQAADTALAQAQEQQEQILGTARQQAQEIIEQARRHADAEGQKIVAQAKAQAQKLVDDGQRQVQRDKDKMLLEVKGELADIIAIGVEKVVDQQVSPEDIGSQYLQAGLEA